MGISSDCPNMWGEPDYNFDQYFDFENAEFFEDEYINESSNAIETAIGDKDFMYLKDYTDYWYDMETLEKGDDARDIKRDYRDDGISAFTVSDGNYLMANDKIFVAVKISDIARKLERNMPHIIDVFYDYMVNQEATEREISDSNLEPLVWIFEEFGLYDYVIKTRQDVKNMLDGFFDVVLHTPSMAAIVDEMF